MSLHSFQTAHLLYPLEHLAADVDAVAGGSVVKAVGVCLSLPLQHGGSSGKNVVGDKVFARDNYNYARRAYVFLNAAVDNAVLGNVYRLRKEAGRNVGYQSVALSIRQGLVLSAVDGVVLADVNVVCVLGNIEV